jgi:ParB-like chromosome segregation protein Spo0J
MKKGNGGAEAATKNDKSKNKPAESFPPDWPAAAIQYRPVSELMPRVDNPRQHPVEQIDRLAASITEFGWTIPVLVDEDGAILSGHGRILAASKLQIESIPTMTARGWPDDKKKAYLIADNKLAEGSRWDTELLHLQLSELAAVDFDLDILGFDAAEISGLTEGAYAPKLSPEKDGNMVSEDDIREANASLIDRPKERAKQDLVRVICPHCAEEFLLDPEKIGE